MSNIRASVRLEKSVVFAGESIQCVITFTNISPVHGPYHAASPNSQPRGGGSARERWKEILPLQNRNNRTTYGPGAAPNIHQTDPRGHRLTLSLHNSVGGKHLPTSSLRRVSRENDTAPGHKHKHSISIVSINGDTSTSEELRVHGRPPTSLYPSRRHGRSASLQILPSRISAAKAGPLSGKNPLKADTHS